MVFVSIRTVETYERALEAQRESLQQFMSETAETANEVTQQAKDTVARGFAQIRAEIDAGGPFDTAIRNLMNRLDRRFQTSCVRLQKRCSNLSRIAR